MNGNHLHPKKITSIVNYILIFQIYDGISLSDPLIQRFCGQTTINITTSSNVVLVRFKSDFSVSHEGFNITYSEQNGKSKITRLLSLESQSGRLQLLETLSVCVLCVL